MKKILIIAIVIANFTSINYTLIAQSYENILVSKIENTEQKIEITLSSKQPFFVGGNRYALHIGEKYLLKSKHPNGNINLLTFILSEKEFKELTDNCEMYLTYGFNKSNIGKTSDLKGKNWNVGKLNKEMLNN